MALRQYVSGRVKRPWKFKVAIYIQKQKIRALEKEKNEQIKYTDARVSVEGHEIWRKDRKRNCVTDSNCISSP